MTPPVGRARTLRWRLLVHYAVMAGIAAAAIPLTVLFRPGRSPEFYVLIFSLLYNAGYYAFAIRRAWRTRSPLNVGLSLKMGSWLAVIAVVALPAYLDVWLAPVWLRTAIWACVGLSVPIIYAALQDEEQRDVERHAVRDEARDLVRDLVRDTARDKEYDKP
jgi:hypothetical protein